MINNLTVGKYSYGVSSINVISFGENFRISIGNFCSIAKNVTIFAGNGGHIPYFITTFPFGHMHNDVFNSSGIDIYNNTKGDVIIKNDVWIGQNVTIMDGVTIGNGAVIAANSHVVKNVPDYAIFGGNPAKLIRYRFSDDIIEKLLEIQWWDMPDYEINKLLPLLCSNNLDEFINSIKN